MAVSRINRFTELYEELRSDNFEDILGMTSLLHHMRAYENKMMPYVAKSHELSAVSIEADGTFQRLHAMMDVLNERLSPN